MIAGRKLVQQAIERTIQERDNPHSVGINFDRRDGRGNYFSRGEHQRDCEQRLLKLYEALQ